MQSMMINLLVLILLCACSDKDSSTNTTAMNYSDQVTVEAVTFSGNEGNYNFSVTLKSPDTGCDQYADWWEIFDQDGSLIYRRILGHSHVSEQPFVRSGGPVAVNNDQLIYIRGHMNNFGYGSMVFSGTINDGFKQETLSVNFAAELENTQPLPQGCAF